MKAGVEKYFWPDWERAAVKLSATLTKMHRSDKNVQECNATKT